MKIIGSSEWYAFWAGWCTVSGAWNLTESKWVVATFQFGLAVLFLIEMSKAKVDR